jgi:hypothetical protein
MTVKQIYELVNASTKQVLGETAILTEDLSNVVDIGTEIFNANAVDNYVKTLVDRIGKVIFVNRPYSGSIPSVLMDSWEYGSVTEKIQMDLPEAEVNETWELQDGATYDQNFFYQPKITVKFFNQMTTFDIPMSITERQVQESFTSAQALGSFIGMIWTMIENSMTVKLDSLILMTINNMISLTDSDNGGGEAQHVHLLTEYKALNPDFTKTGESAMTDLDFLKYCAYRIKLVAGRMTQYSKVFNAEKKSRHTPKDLMHIVLLSDFKNAADVYLQSDTFHNELSALPNSESVQYWQGSGDGTDAFTFANTSKINIKDAKGNSYTKSNIIGVIFDRDALGVTKKNTRIRSHVVDKAEFYNYWYKADVGYFNDLSENFVCFLID